MGFVDFLKDVVCAPYSIPIGLINNKKPLRMCSKTTKKELKLQDTSSRSKSYKEELEHNVPIFHHLLNMKSLMLRFRIF